jgi:hypothetical protein
MGGTAEQAGAFRSQRAPIEDQNTHRAVHLNVVLVWAAKHRGPGALAGFAGAALMSACGIFVNRNSKRIVRKHPSTPRTEHYHRLMFVAILQLV